ncbi:MAG TPA: amino acid adenylation domain-containing protein [Thermoanaerobaculia bacterium]|nr:amino acid adenylation domain-containing protein [Thermoanaerobaculia bacterium]
MSGDRSSRFQLSTDRLALLRALRSEKGLGEGTRQAIPRREEGETYPLSFGQERLWFLDRLNPGAAAYNLRAAVRLDGALDPAALERALAALVARQSALATIFTTVEGEHGEETPVQSLVPAHSAGGLRAPLLADLSALPPALRERTLRRLAAREASRPFDLERGPLLRVARVRLAAESQALVIAVHHIAADGWSMDLLVRELAALYRAEMTGEATAQPPLSTLPIRYVDYAAWQRERAAAGALDGELSAWRERLAGAPLVLDLPTDRPRPAVPTFRGGLAAAALSGSLAADLSALARRAEATPFMLLLALFGLTLRRHADPGGALEDVLLGTPIANRQRPEVANLIGFFANTLVMRVELSGDPTFAELLAKVRAAALAAQGQQDLPFERLVEALHPERTLDRTPIFQAMLVVDHAPSTGTSAGASAAQPSGGAPALVPLAVPGGSARFELTLAATVGEGAFRMALEYAADLFDGTTARRWLGRLAALAEAAVATPEAAISRLPLLPAAERHQTLIEWNAGPWAEGFSVEEPRLDRLFAAAVAAGPERLAVSCAGTVWTYAELAAEAERVRRRIVARSAGAPERTIALALRRSPLLIASILGTLAADAAYLPLDPEAPDERLAWTIEDSQAALVLVDVEERDRFAALLGEGGADRVLVLSEGDAEDSGHPTGLSDGLSDRLAYVIYTSGSTGRPKGVMVSHRAACATLLWRLARYSPRPGDVMLQNISTTFDPSVWQIFGALLSGARLALLPPEERQDFAAIARRLAAERGTITDLAPSMLRAFLDQDGLDECRDLRLLFAGGMALPPDLAARFNAQFPRAALYNIYGPTEVAIDAATWEAAPRPGATVVPIGRPAAGKRLFVLDARLQPVPIGVPGELYVGCLPAISGGGGGLARGYLGSPDLTAERFVPNPFASMGGSVCLLPPSGAFGSSQSLRDKLSHPSEQGSEDDVPGSRLYRTGDLVRLLADGVAEFLGRVDRQVKVRGFRIELGEVEAAIAGHPQVREAHAAARERGGETELAAWFAPDWPGAVAEVRAYLVAGLPEHLVPAALAALGALPRNASGKVDARLLPEPSAMSLDARPFRPPGGGLESSIAEIWREVLGREQVGVDDNFFDLGGHSLLLVRVHGRLKKLLGREVPIVDLFAHPTVAALAGHLSPLSPLSPPAGGVAEPAGGEARRSSRPPRPLSRSADGSEASDAIAIVAVAGRFPGAADVEQLWQNLLEGRDSIRSFSAEELLAAGHTQALIDRPDYVRARGSIDDVDLFDAGFFGLGAREAEMLDPQHRLFLEIAWEALERAGRDPGRGGPIGVFAGTSVSTYLLRNVLANPQALRGGGLAQAHLGADKDFLATRASYLLDLKGPSLAVQTACSTSLVAVHLACRSLRDGECDLALAGGVSIAVPQVEGYVYQEGGILSPDGRCRPFDAAAAGTVSGSGVGFVVLARLADALANGSPIVAVIRGSAINNDGAAKVGYTAPGIEGQASAIAAALVDADVEPGRIGYVEAHGTATPLGDPIEIAALGRAYGSFEGEIAPGSIPIGSIKSNIGHLDAAAGVAGLIKAALALEREEIPPSLHFERPNPRIDLAETPFRVAAERTPWPREETPRFAGVSSFGIGGTNVHVVLEEAPVRVEEPSPAAPRAAQLLLWSARSEAALDSATGRLAAHWAAHPDLDLPAVAYTLAAGRKRFARRAALVARSSADAAAALAERDPERLLFGADGGDEIRRSVAFLLPGQGAQRFAMGAGLYAAEPVFRAAFEECAVAIDPHLMSSAGLVAALGLSGRPQGEQAEAGESEVRDTALAQPALFALEVALARLWESWGVRPVALLGHSIGEYAAAHLAGVFTLEDAGRVVALRGRLMSALTSGASGASRAPGAMLGVPLGEEATRAMLAGTDLDLAAVNGPELSVVSGSEEEIAAFSERLADQGLEGRRLRTAHAFHSRAMEPILAPFGEILRSVEFSPPRLPFLSNLTGGWISPAEATDPGYWLRHLREPVRFGDGLAALLAERNLALLEVGPGRSLSGLARRQTTAATPIVASLGDGEGGAAGESEAMLGALGRLWLAGVETAAEEATGSVRRSVVLPTYPFERRRYWIDPAPALSPVARRNLDRLPESDWMTTPVWREVTASPTAQEETRDWLLVADRLGIAERLADRLRSRGDRATLVSGSEALGALEDLPPRVIHLANVTAGSADSVEAALDRAFHELAALARAYGEKGRPLDLTVVADGLCDIAGEGRIEPVKSALLGLVRALPLESPGTTCRALDVLAGDPERLTASLPAELDRTTTADPDHDFSLVALRGGRRFVRAVEKLTEEGGTAAAGLREGGVVLVTGGMSGLGLEIAGHLARTRGAKLVLVGRTLKSTPLEGPEVLTLAVDVADPAAMRWAVERAIERFGALHGVIHAAGVAGGGVVQLRERAAAAAVLAPKVEGTFALAAAVSVLPALDLFVVCSSLAALLGGAGQSDYAAGNAVLDAFAESERAAGHRVLSIDWDAWREVGMAARVHPEGTDGLATAEGLAAFDRAVASGHARVVVSTRDVAALRARFRPAAEPAAVSSEAAPPHQAAAHERPALATPYLAPRDATERALAAVWQEVLGVGPIGVHDDFTELGGHSLLALQVVARIRRDLSAELPLAALFEAPTIARLALRIQPMDAAGPAAADSEPQVEGGDFPLSFAQERLWFIDRLEPGQAAYNMPGAVRLGGALDERVLAGTLTELVRRHAVLRTTFPSAGGRPVQRVPPLATVSLPILDLSALEPGLAASRALAQALAFGRLPFDLERGPVFRALLLRLSGMERILAFALHHIVSDGGSMRVIQHEVGRLYAAFAQGLPSPLPALLLSYGEYARRERSEMAEGGRLAAELENRTRRLTPLPAPLDLPSDRARPDVQTFRGALEPLRIPRALTVALRAAARRTGVTPFMLLLAAFAALIERLTGRTDFALGTPIGNRDRVETEGMIGLFVNTIVLRLDLAGDPTFDELLARVRTESVAAFASASLPFERLITALSPERDLSRSPLFQVLFAFQAAAGEGAEVSSESAAAALAAEPLALDAGRAMFDLTLTLDDAGTRFQGGLEYATDLFDRTRIQRTAGQLLRLLESALAEDGEPARRLANLDLLSTPERHQLLTEWEGEVGAGGAGSMQERFFRQAERTPDAVALIWGAERWSYADLAAKARGIAHRLRTECGVEPENVVGISARRTPHLIAGLLGILEAGAVYLPLDPAYPDERLAFMLADAQARAALVDGATSERMATLAPDLRRLDLESVDPAPSLPHVLVDARQLAYLIYTSGSTGRPKGVAIEHRSAGALLDWAGRTFSAADLSGVLAATSIAFDLSVFEIFAPLSFGGAVILAEDALALRGLPAFGEVTLINTVPSALTELVRGGAPPSLSVVCVAGEPLPRSLVDAVQGHWGCDNVWNLYGPSEDTTYSTGVRVPSGIVAPTIGRPLAGSRARILDGQGAVLPVGVPDELALAGAGLARGYYGRPDLTAERFVPDPFGQAGTRIYRTGDLARFRADGELEYLGRIDGQMKIRGFRIELGEVEEALRSLSGVVEAAVLATADRTRLVAFVVASQEAAGPRFDEWRAALGGKLPGHFVPSLWQSVVALPRTINGKVDRRALAVLAAEGADASTAAAGAAALGPLEELVGLVWAQVLELPVGHRIGRDDDFFALGGHSLLAAQTLARLADACGVELPVRALFEAPTVAGLATRIEAAGRVGEGAPPLPPIAPLTRGKNFRPPLSFGQLRLWFLDRLEPDAAGRAAYNLPAALRLSGALESPALAAALTELVRRHEALRTSFRIEGEEPFQAIADPAPILLPFCDLTGLSASHAARTARRLADGEVRRPFDLGEGPLLRALLMRRGASEHDLILTLHHAASDGASMSLLERELPQLYAAALAGRPSPLPPLPIQYADYAAWQRGLLSGAALDREVDWWRTLLAGAPPRLDLPTDHPRPRLQTFRGDSRGRALARPEVLRRLARELSATPYMVALAAWGALLGRAAGQAVVVVGSPIANRPRPELERLIGFFANTLALPVDLSGDPPFSGLVECVRTASLGAFAHSAVPFEKLVEQLAPARDLAGSPLFQTLLSFQAGAPRHAEEGASIQAATTLRMAPITAEVGSAKFDLTLALQAFGAATVATLEWNADLFDPATALRLLDRFERLLDAAAADGRSSVSRLSLLAPGERQQVLIETNDSARPCPESISVFATIARTAARKPDAVAIHAGGEHLSYGELVRRGRRLGAKLRHDFAVGDDSVVAISLPRTPSQLVGLLAILEAGGAYLPLDPTTPAERLAFLLSDARAKVLVTETGFLSAPVDGTRVLNLDREEWPDESETSRSAEVFLPERIGYVLYTSGSTGVPKGVAVGHRSLANLLETIRERPGLAERDVLLGVTGLWFDIASVEMLLPLVVGARLELVDRAEAADGGRLLARLTECGATVMQATPGTWRLLIDAGWSGGESSPLDVRSTGEALPPALAAELVARSERVWNLYGPTETTIYSSLARVRSQAVAIGRPVGNTDLVVAETGAALGFWFGEPAPPGALGELLIGGSGVARGYLGRPDLTAERFVPDPFSGRPGARAYRSGDRVRALPSGELLYLGRGDFQVKIRGFRIELAEIEAALEAHPGVVEAVVVARSAPRDAQPGGEDGDLRLIAYWVATVGSTPGEPSLEALRDHLRGKLPSHMVPWAFVPLAALPRNRNGKVDRGALPVPERAAWSGGVAFEEPRTETERRVAAIWGAALGLERVGVDDNFFDSGGHSLLAVKVHQRLRTEFGREFPLVALFAHPTIRSLARHLAPAAPDAAAGGDGGAAGGEAAVRGRDRGLERRQAAARRRGGKSEEGGTVSKETEPGVERNP